MGRLKGSKDGIHTTIKISCNYCKRTYKAYPAHANKSKYCSRSCKNKSLIGKKHTPEHNKNIGLAQKGRKHSKKTIALMRSSQHKRYASNPISIETRNKMSTSASKPKKGGKCITIEGYVLIWSPNHPHKNCNNYVLEHRLVMEAFIGRLLNSKEVVHHINGIVDDNRIKNLQLFDDWKTHIQFHKKQPA